MYNNLDAEKNKKVNTLSKKIKDNNLTYYFKGESNPILKIQNLVF